MADNDLDAINEYIMRTPAVTPKAVTIKDTWVAWFDDLSWYSKHLDSDTYDKARNIRADFNLANARTAEEKQDVKRVITTGLTTEEMREEAKRINSKGKLPEHGEPWIPTEYKWAVGLLGAASVLLFAYKAPQAIAGALLTKKNANPGIKDESAWERAKAAIKPRWEQYEKPWGAVTKVYKNMTGEK